MLPMLLAARDGVFSVAFGSVGNTYIWVGNTLGNTFGNTCVLLTEPVLVFLPRHVENTTGI